MWLGVWQKDQGHSVAPEFSMCFSHQVQLIFEHTDQWKASVPVLPRLPALITRGYQSRSLRISSDTWCTVKRLQISSENHLHSNYGGTGSVFIQACRGLELRDELAVKCKSAMLLWVRPHFFVLAEDLITRTQLIYHREQEIQFPTRGKKKAHKGIIIPSPQQGNAYSYLFSILHLLVANQLQICFRSRNQGPPTSF